MEFSAPSVVHDKKSGLSKVLRQAIFNVGTHKGNVFTLADLEDMARNFKQMPFMKIPSIPKVASAKLGHNEKDNYGIRSGYPAVGWVSNLVVEDETLVADFDGVPYQVAVGIEKQAFKTKSSEIAIYCDPEYKDADGNTLGCVLVGVAFLGEELPAVPDLNDLHTLYITEENADDFTAVKLSKWVDCLVTPPVRAEQRISEHVHTFQFSKNDNHERVNHKMALTIDEAKTAIGELTGMADALAKMPKDDAGYESARADLIGKCKMLAAEFTVNPEIESVKPDFDALTVLLIDAGLATADELAADKPKTETDEEIEAKKTKLAADPKPVKMSMDDAKQRIRDLADELWAIQKPAVALAKPEEFKTRRAKLIDDLKSLMAEFDINPDIKDVTDRIVWLYNDLLWAGLIEDGELSPADAEMKAEFAKRADDYKAAKFAKADAAKLKIELAAAKTAIDSTKGELAEQLNASKAEAERLRVANVTLTRERNEATVAKQMDEWKKFGRTCPAQDEPLRRVLFQALSAPVKIEFAKDGKTAESTLFDDLVAVFNAVPSNTVVNFSETAVGEAGDESKVEAIVKTDSRFSK